MKCLRFYSPLIFTLFCISAGTTTHAQDQSAAPKKTAGFENLAVNTFISAGISYNANVPDSRKNQLRVFDTDDNSFKIDVLELSLQKLAPNPGDVGFCFHLAAGSSVPKAVRSSGLNSGDVDFHQMYVRYIADVGSGMTIDIGKFATPLGYELIEGFDGYNDNVSRSFLFGYAIPFTHTGVRIAYPFSSVVTGTILLVNGWDNAIDNNRSKSLGGQLSVAPATGLILYANCIYGPEQNDNNRDNRTVLDLSGSYLVSQFFTFGINGDYGSEERATSNGTTAAWNGVAAYCRFNLSDQFALTLRGEHFEDQNGARTGVAQKLREVTLTPEFRPTEGFIVRGDFRVDISSAKVFEKNSGLTDKQFTVSANVLYVH